jgi:hypothetical protein
VVVSRIATQTVIPIRLSKHKRTSKVRSDLAQFRHILKVGSGTFHGRGGSVRLFNIDVTEQEARAGIPAETLDKWFDSIRIAGNSRDGNDADVSPLAVLDSEKALISDLVIKYFWF